METDCLADTFTSDVHLTFEAEERSERFARFVRGLAAGDRLTIVGDLCDFWLASRQRRLDPSRNAGLNALTEFRSRGGRLNLLLGNHDGHMGPYYRHWFGDSVVDEPFAMTSHGRRVQLEHGHRVGARKPWKALMESRWFMRAFGALPGPIARASRLLLDMKNNRDLAATHRRHLDKFRHVASDPAADAELFFFGHVHEPFDVSVGDRRLIVLGDWFEDSPYVRIDAAGVTVVTSRARLVPTPLGS